jgi:quercetin dioxygenase-like cupin family protein
MGRLGDGETGGRGDWGTGRHGDAGTRREGGRSGHMDRRCDFRNWGTGTGRWYLAVAVLVAAGGVRAEDSVKFDTPEVRVLVATSSPGQRSGVHQHRLNRVMIYLDDGHMELTDAQGKVEEVRWKAGDVRWSPAGGPHVSENVGMTTYRIVEVELKKSGGTVPESALDPVRVDPKHYRVEFENDQVRVLRARYGPREAGVLHEHILNRVIVLLSEEHMRVTTEDGKSTEALGRSGDVTMGGPARHREENVNLVPFEVAVVELKR